MRTLYGLIASLQEQKAAVQRDLAVVCAETDVFMYEHTYVCILTPGVHVYRVYTFDGGQGAFAFPPWKSINFAPSPLRILTAELYMHCMLHKLESTFCGMRLHSIG